MQQSESNTEIVDAEVKTPGLTEEDKEQAVVLAKAGLTRLCNQQGIGVLIIEVKNNQVSMDLPPNASVSGIIHALHTVGEALKQQYGDQIKAEEAKEAEAQSEEPKAEEAGSYEQTR